MYKLNSENELTPLSSPDSEMKLTNWLEEHPGLLGEELMIIAKGIHLKPDVGIDMLAMDKGGSLVVIRVQEGGDEKVHTSAVTQATYVSTLSHSEIFYLLAEYLDEDEDDAQEEVEEFIDAENFDALNLHQRIILVASDIHAHTAATALWLREYGVDMSCVKVTPYQDENGNVFIQPVKIIPTAEAEEYIRKKEGLYKAAKEEGRSSFSMEIGEYDTDELKERLMASLERNSAVIPRLIIFLKLLASEDRAFTREEVKEEFFKNGIGKSVSNAGRYMGAISQLLTKQSNDHFRQVLVFDTDGPGGEVKDEYYIIEGYRGLMGEVLSEVG